MNDLEHVINLLKNNYANATIDARYNGQDFRLFWQDRMVYDGEVTDHNRSIICEGWKVITWKRGKAIELYFGDSFSEALKVFESKTKENE